MTAADPRLIAFYLPQFHPIPENDEWWGKGFTEWTNAAKARPMYRGHYQPHVPADLGFYDLRLLETREAQAAMAREHGIEAFCYWHYWFGGGRRLLERPFDEVLDSGKPDFPFCLSWANQTWSGIWHGAPKRVLTEQTYPGVEDHRAHFDFLLRAFKDERYVRVDGKPFFMVYEAAMIPDVRKVTSLWREWAANAGLPGLHFVGWQHFIPKWEPAVFGFDAYSSGLPRTTYGRRTPYKWLRNVMGRKRGLPSRYGYEEVAKDMERTAPQRDDHYPCVLPNWDNSPRSGGNGLVLEGSTPELFRVQLRGALDRAKKLLPEGRRIVFVKSWNEWAEGNHLEPDLKFGRGYLDVVRDEVARFRGAP